MIVVEGIFKKRMERQEFDDEHEEHTVGSLDTSMDRYLEHHGLWRKRIPQGTKDEEGNFMRISFI